MSIGKFLVTVAAVSMAVAPAAAQSAKAAGGLSLAPVGKSVRVASPAGKKTKAVSAGVIVLAVVAVGGAIGGIVAATSNGSGPASP